MKNNSGIFEKETFKGYMTSAQLKRNSECVKEYKGYSIQFGKYEKDENGIARWRVSVWKNEGRDRWGEFQMKNLCATDCDAMFIATQWAKANIDKLAA